ncbi:MAG: DHA2 family efflux MFS transporter permease subunit [Candidatus Promineifilaceae bacterium]
MDADAIDYSRKWYVMLAVGMGVFLSTIDGSIVNVALPTLVRAFATDFATVQWVVLAYLLTVSTLMLSVGRLADMIGKKRLYTAGFIVFTTGSVLCGLSPTIHWLIGFRALQAIGASMILALGMAIITESFPPEERGRALGISGAVVSVGIAVGPTMGGILIDALSWHWIFFVNLPVGVAGTVLAFRYVPSTRPAGGERFDYWGGLTFFISLFAFLMALTLGQQAGFANRSVLLLFAGAATFMIVFVLIEWRTKDPMIDLRMFKSNLFSVGLITGFITFVAIAGTVLLIPFYLEDVLGYDPRQVGLLLAVVPVALGITSPLSGSLSDRFGTRLITVIGLLVLVGGYYVLSTLGPKTTALGFVLRFLPIGIGMGVFQSPNNSAIMGSAPRKRLGVASGMLAITRTLGQTTGIAVLGAIWASRVLHYSGAVPSGGATSASPAMQAAGLQDTFLIVTVLVGAALLLATWALIARRGEEERGSAFEATASQ